MAIVDELREALMNCEDSYREIGRQIDVDHALLTRFAKGEKSLSLATAEKLANHLGLRLE
ncbi:MAG: helix-turn-helix transcriptional regulator [Pirellulaceae bacterium]|jgi:plasmid maintenance system antidote protein VapI|nr:helix-turn-helix transcriptional regulator [Pirellulaceae bacterium]